MSKLRETTVAYGLYQQYAMGATNTTLVSITAVLSMIGSILIIFSFIAWKDMRTKSREVLVWLSICDFLIALANICGTYFKPTMDDTKCVVQSFILSSASISSFLWSTTLALCLYMTVIANKQDRFKSCLPFLHILNWGLGLAINSFAVKKNMLGNSFDEITAGWCWINHNHTVKINSTKANSPTRNEKLWMLLDYKGIEIVAYAVIFLLYLKIKFHLSREIKNRMMTKTSTKKKISSGNVMKIAKVADRKLIFIPILLILARLPGTLRFLLFYTSNTNLKPRTVDKVLLSLQGIGDSAQGLLNCVFFCFLQRRVLQHFKEFCLKYLRCGDSDGGRILCLSSKDTGNITDFENIHEEDSTLFTNNSKSPLLEKKNPVEYYGK